LLWFNHIWWRCHAGGGYTFIEVIVYPFLIVSLLLLPFVIKDIKNFYSVPIHISLLFFLSDFISVFEFLPLYLGCSVSLVVFLLYSHPIWTVLFSYLFLKEKPSKNDYISLGIIILGKIILIKPWDDFSYSIVGIIIAILAGMGMSGWIILSSYYSKKDLKPFTLTFFTSIYAAIPFLIFGVCVVPIFPEVFNSVTYIP